MCIVAKTAEARIMWFSLKTWKVPLFLEFVVNVVEKFERDPIKYQGRVGGGVIINLIIFWYNIVETMQYSLGY